LQRKKGVTKGRGGGITGRETGGGAKGKRKRTRGGGSWKQKLNLFIT